MSLSSVLRFEDVKDSPSVRINLPSPLPIGTRINLCFVVRRKHKGRSEELHVDGSFRVTSVCLDATQSLKQEVIVTATGVAPVWKAVKNQVPAKLALTRPPRTQVT